MIKKTVLIFCLLGMLTFIIACDKTINTEEIVKYTVNFDTDGGTMIEDIIVDQNSLIEMPQTHKDGYEVDGWFKDASKTIPWIFENNRVNENITLYVQWKKIESVEPNLNLEELLNQMKSTIYTKKYTNTSDMIGLSNPSNVGVDQELLENEVRYPVPEASTFDYVFNVKDYGITPDMTDNTFLLRTLLNEVKKLDGSKMIYFPKGTYYFSETISINQIDSLYLVGEEAEWVMNSWLTIIEVKESSNFHINNIDFDYKISPTISGTIVNTNPELRQVEILVDDEFDMTNHRYTNGQINYGNYMEYVYDETFNVYIPDADGMLRYNSTGDRINGIKSGVYNPLEKTLTLEFDPIQGKFINPKLGKVVSVGYTMYEHTGIVFDKCENIYMESVNIYTTPGMSIMAVGTKNIYFNRTNIMLRNGSKRLMTATADGVHTMDSFGDIIISNSIFEASHDDAINIKTFYFKVNSALRKNVTVSMTTTETRIPIHVGDKLEFFEGGSFSSKAVREVIEVRNFGTSYELVLDSNLPNGLVKENDLVANLSRVPNVTIENSIFRNKRNRGILFQTRDSVIKNSTFYNILHGPIMVHAGFDIFSEGVVPKNIVIENSKFIQNNQARGTRADVNIFRYGGVIKENTITNVDIRNNFFHLSSYSAIFLQGTGEINIHNNLFYDVATKALSSGNLNSSIALNITNRTKLINNFTYLTENKNNYINIEKRDDIETIEENNEIQIGGVIS